ncbi:hypothetical protein BSIN_2636 [Burkholderia singularis]|uniref:Uncharacterized protein n=1 Tax=Burkholderia singularis TaxID=1503053 RepID=A0A238HBZ8_9BURK|nr:hypothetical protein BSIN_2636 [Burkholderia singularis]
MVRGACGAHGANNFVSFTNLSAAFILDNGNENQFYLSIE